MENIKMTKKAAEKLGYKPAKVLPTGECAGIMKMAFTTGLFVGITPHFYRTRYCYESPVDAMNALEAWNGKEDPPGNWIKKKGDGEKSNPNYVPTEQS